jgi:Flp pilus assembly pilin Flp
MAESEVMMMKSVATRFATDESGAVTVDWVVLTASIVGLGVMVVALLTGNLGSVGARVNSFLSSQTVSTTF